MYGLDECFVTTQLGYYLSKVSDSISRLRGELARERLTALKEPQQRHKWGHDESFDESSSAEVISFSLPSNKTTLIYPELSYFLNEVNNSNASE